MRLVADFFSRLPAVENIGEAEQPAHHARFGVLRGASEKVVVVEIEIDDLTVALHRDARDVVAEIAIPVHAQSAWIRDHVAAIALRLFRQLRPIDLPLPQRIESERPALVAVPEPDDQLHQQVTEDLVPVLHRGVVEFWRISPEAGADFDEIAELSVPVIDE